jgi:predicted RNase H-like nuclease (RuvC/YqgF family)
MLFIGSLFLAGCGLPNELTIDRPAAKAVETTPEEPPMVIGQTPEKMQKRFDPTIQDDGDLEQGELRWAQRYEELSVGNNALRETNHELTLENDQLKQQVKMLKSELEQTKKDMTEANEFLGQMHLELNKWKTDVLGFRQEIRQAQQVQIEALGKILRVLGAETIDIPVTPEESVSGVEETK